MKKVIDSVSILSDPDQKALLSKISRRVDDFQKKNLQVDIQYSTNTYCHFAMLVAYKMVEER